MVSFAPLVYLGNGTLPLVLGIVLQQDVLSKVANLANDAALAMVHREREREREIKFEIKKRRC